MQLLCLKEHIRSQYLPSKDMCNVPIYEVDCWRKERKKKLRNATSTALDFSDKQFSKGKQSKINADEIIGLIASMLNWKFIWTQNIQPKYH